MREKEFKSLKADLEHHKEHHEYYRTKCERHEKVNFFATCDGSTVQGSSKLLPKYSASGPGPSDFWWIQGKPKIQKVKYLFYKYKLNWMSLL